MDGSAKNNWMVLDFFDVIVHVMRPEVREKYDLEGLWGDAIRVRTTRRKVKTGGVAESGPGKKVDAEA